MSTSGLQRTFQMPNFVQHCIICSQEPDHFSRLMKLLYSTLMPTFCEDDSLPIFHRPFNISLEHVLSSCLNEGLTKGLVEGRYDLTDHDHWTVTGFHFQHTSCSSVGRRGDDDIHHYSLFVGH